VKVVILVRQQLLVEASGLAPQTFAKSSEGHRVHKLRLLSGQSVFRVADAERVRDREGDGARRHRFAARANAPRHPDD
jgi:hypothetical protein